MTHTTRESLFKLLESLNEYAWVENLETHQVRMSSRFWELLGYEPETAPVTRETVRKLIHPADLELAAEEMELHLLANEPFEFELRYRAASGEWRDLRVRGCIAERNGEGQPVTVGGIINDVTEQIVAARAHSRAEDLIATLSNRERQVLNCLVAGAASKNIAFGLGISQRTVEGYRARIMEKLGVHGVGDLVQLAVAGGVTAGSATACGQAPPS